MSYNIDMLNRIMLVACDTSYFVTEDGRVWSRHSKKFLKPGTVGGYKQVCLRTNNLVQQKKVHRLVAEAFIGSIPAGMHACHNNGDRADNRLSNIRIDTPVGNAADKKRHGTYLCGEKVGTSGTTDYVAASVRSALESGRTGRDVAREFGLSESVVSNIRRATAWSHVAGDPLKRRRKLRDDQVLAIRRRIEAGEPKTAIARDIGVSRYVVGDIARGKAYADVK